MPSICRFVATCPDRSPRHRIQLASWRSGRIYSRGIAPRRLWNRGCCDCIACRRHHRIWPPVKPWPDRFLRRLVRGTVPDGAFIEHCTWPVPPTASHPARSTYSIAPGLFRPWLCQKLSWEPENKKSVRIATFLRLGIVAWLQIADRGVKTWIIGHKAADFSLCRGGRESLIEKKLQRSENFCFCPPAGAVPPATQRLGIIFAFSTVVFVYAVS